MTISSIKLSCGANNIHFDQVPFCLCIYAVGDKIDAYILFSAIY